MSLPAGQTWPTPRTHANSGPQGDVNTVSLIIFVVHYQGNSVCFVRLATRRICMTGTGHEALPSVVVATVVTPPFHNTLGGCVVWGVPYRVFQHQRFGQSESTDLVDDSPILPAP